MRTHTYTDTYTRAEAVVDQFDMFLQYAGVREKRRSELLRAIENRWIDKIGIYLTDQDGKRFLEVSLGVDWPRHEALAAVSPQIRTDLPGWDDGAAPEIRVLGRRFGQKALEYKKTPRTWVMFKSEIRRNKELHKKLCEETGHSYEGSVPEWRDARRYAEEKEVLDLEEVTISLEEA